MREIIDTAVVQELRTVLGADFALLVGTFASDSARRIADLRAAVQSGDAEAARAAAHSLKGSSLNVGALAVSDLALHLEQAARRGEMAALGGDIDALEAAVAAAAARLRAL